MPRPPKTDEKRHEIVQRAAELFDTEGYEHVSMDRIADAVGLRKSTLYHYIRSKHDLLYLINDEFLSRLIEQHEARLGMGMDPSHLLLEIMGDILDMMHEHRGHARVFFEHIQDLSPAQRREVETMRGRYYGHVLEAIKEGVRRGDFATPDPQLTALAMFGMCSWSYTWYRPEGRLTSRAVAYHFWRLLIDGLATSTAATPGGNGASPDPVGAGTDARAVSDARPGADGDAGSDGQVGRRASR